ncbi:hypothetical protein K438DRAFT_1758078 [Mycena galopus ATCC 62051]|nr:hypothetical protein K438DRAFT_1758078 [Mycena galopus ATCC 62051]
MVICSAFSPGGWIVILNKGRMDPLQILRIRLSKPPNSHYSSLRTTVKFSNLLTACAIGSHGRRSHCTSVLFSGVNSSNRVTVHNEDGCTPASQVEQGFDPACWNKGATALRSAWVACPGKIRSHPPREQSDFGRPRPRRQLSREESGRCHRSHSSHTRARRAASRSTTSTEEVDAMKR